MAGLSLKCGNCGILLKSVEEAQEHAELTNHADFSESTEPVLNLVCCTCGKPCRTKTVLNFYKFAVLFTSIEDLFYFILLILNIVLNQESDLHTKRTNHTEFTDKTSETAKPIALEVAKNPNNDVDMVDATTSAEPEGTKLICF